MTRIRPLGVGRGGFSPALYSDLYVHEAHHQRSPRVAYSLQVESANIGALVTITRCVSRGYHDRRAFGTDLLKGSGKAKLLEKSLKAAACLTALNNLGTRKEHREVIAETVRFNGECSAALAPVFFLRESFVM